jgi:DNA-binding MarR family transcriptional regulator
MNQSRAGSLDVNTLLHTAYGVQDELEGKLGEVGLSLAKLSALQALSEAGESLPLSQLAERLSCVKSNITQLVDRLEADGFVRRESDPRDRRAKLAALTAEGRNACHEGTRIHQAAERELLTTLTREEANQLAALLGKLRKQSR